ncbi:hypothetical protein BWP39_25060 [Paraburkholderia acidicola]|uniref:DUF3331 domain-containing protein n=1 Tax=Paraburkholderia acidicola TaxID=1912599 RepID=A0A2A4ES25_9BURK|nr:DUF3331 domain-containing protein [Paraburkholderia acidicola]PCE22956.1 hypothetical protein BWP39_25060 [Paraburkholderia acidicola]
MTTVRHHLFGLEAEVSILERGADDVWMRWLEPGRCHYGEQRWAATVARGSGKCALTGAPIRRGDRIFRPTGRPRPSNANVLILADQIVKILDSASVGEAG